MPERKRKQCEGGERDMEENEERIKELIKSFCQQTEGLIEYFDVDINNNMQK